MRRLRRFQHFAFRQLGCLHLEFADRQFVPDDVTGLGFEAHPSISYLVDLKPDEEAIYHRFSSKSCRYPIRKAAKEGVVVEEASDEAFADEYYAQLKDVFAKQNLVPTYGPDRVRLLIKHLFPTGNLFCCGLGIHSALVLQQEFSWDPTRPPTFGGTPVGGNTSTSARTSRCTGMPCVFGSGGAWKSTIFAAAAITSASTTAKRSGVLSCANQSIAGRQWLAVWPFASSSSSNGCLDSEKRRIATTRTRPDSGNRSHANMRYCKAVEKEMTGLANVRAATPDDIRDVARIHKARFCGPSLTLGHFSVSLISKFYRSFLGRYVFLVHTSERGVDGFVLGGEREELFSAKRTFIFSNLGRCCWEIVLHLHLWPAVFHFIRRFFIPQEKDFVRPLAPDLPRLFLLCVAKAAEGSGAATALVKAFESVISSRYAGYWLTVSKSNHRAVRFYQRLGLTVVVDAFPRGFMFQKEFEPSGEVSPPPAKERDDEDGS